MCEPFVLKKTGKTVVEHQSLTIDSLKALEDASPDIPWMPVLQGWEESDYWRHIEEYQRRGVSLRDYPVVGIGSVCRRQATNEIASLVRSLSAEGLRLHGFGVKIGGLKKIADCLASADSMAWSYGA